MTNGQEEWRDIEGYGGSYQVSNLGRVKALLRKTPVRRGGVVVGGRLRPETILRTKAHHQHGYPTVRLSLNGKLRHLTVHRLVARAFLLDTYFPGALALHGDGDPANNNLENLRWGTISDNLHDCVKHRGHYWAKKTHCANGHPFNTENTRIDVRGGTKTRRCRACKREAYHRSRKLRQSAAA